MKINEQELMAIRYLFESEPERTWRIKEVAATLGYRGRRFALLQKIVQRLIREGAIAELRPGIFGLGQAADLVTGKLILTRSGVGFVSDPAENSSIRIASDDIGIALPGDIVLVRKMFDREQRHAGRIVRIIERGGRDIVGTLTTTGRFLYVTPFDPIYKRDIVVPDANGAREGDRVVVRFLNWANKNVAPEGEIIDVIGPSDRPSLDTEVVIRQHNLPGEFPEAVMREAEVVAQRLDEPGKRLDLRDNTFILTIDPATARDFDDALSLGYDDEGRRQLGVHIADVSHFVQPGSALDQEAAERTTSVYLVDKVIPMLPEQLSNGVCSLHPDADRLCFTAFITFDGYGRPVGRRFAKTMIRSSLRLSYEEALAVIEPEAGREPPQKLPPEAIRLLQELHKLAQQLRKRRMSAGALDLDVPECEIILDDEARMSGVSLRPSDVSHQLIEECMVAANEAVATELKSRGIPIISRLHEPPDELKIEELTASLTELGFKPGNLNNSRNLARFLASTRDHPLRDSAHTLVLRSMKRALYAADGGGHFGLAKKHYSHFTSPIRRYPDLVLHRQLGNRLIKGGRGGRVDPNYLQQTALACTAGEQRADDASRALIEIKKYRFLQQQLEENKRAVYNAVVTRVTNYGLFVDVRLLQLSGLVRITGMSENFVRYDRANETLIADGQRYYVGYNVKVEVSRVDFTQRFVDFVLVK